LTATRIQSETAEVGCCWQMRTSKLRKAFRVGFDRAVRLARELFEEEAQYCTRVDYFDEHGLADPEIGAVYVFFGEHESCLYVGETGMPIRKREGKYPSPLLEEEWWGKWIAIRFLPIEHRAEREILDRLLVLAYQPKFVRRKGADQMAHLFSGRPNR
jgi:hypothetical protein